MIDDEKLSFKSKNDISLKDETYVRYCIFLIKISFNASSNTCWVSPTFFHTMN